MRFEWDDSKNEENRKKHGLSFEVAIEVFDDPFYLSIFDCVVGDEQRYWAVGLIGSLAVVVVVQTWQEADGEEVLRIVSARKASARERRLYEENENFEV
jgi:uncharacterized protein